MVNHLRRRLSESGSGVVTEGHNASIGDVFREEIFQPERLRLRVRPGVDGITAQAMQCHDAGGKPQLAILTEQGNIITSRVHRLTLQQVVSLHPEERTRRTESWTGGSSFVRLLSRVGIQTLTAFESGSIVNVDYTTSRAIEDVSVQHQAAETETSSTAAGISATGRLGCGVTLSQRSV